MNEEVYEDHVAYKEWANRFPHVACEDAEIGFLAGFNIAEKKYNIWMAEALAAREFYEKLNKEYPMLQINYKTARKDWDFRKARQATDGATK